MNWEDEGYLISKKKFRENAIIINLFTKKFGKVTGIVYGGNSRKIRNYLQISNKIFVMYTSKRENKIGYFKTELIKPHAPKYFDNKLKTTVLLSLSSILNSLLPELQPYKNVYNSLNDFIDNLNSENWISLYIFWELDLIKELGFGLSLNDYRNEINEMSDFTSIKIDNLNYKVPNFLILNTPIKNNIDKRKIAQYLNFTRNILLNKFFIPNNLIFPKSRTLLENYFN